MVTLLAKIMGTFETVQCRLLVWRRCMHDTAQLMKWLATVKTTWGGGGGGGGCCWCRFSARSRSRTFPLRQSVETGLWGSSSFVFAGYRGLFTRG